MDTGASGVYGVSVTRTVIADDNTERDCVCINLTKAPYRRFRAVVEATPTTNLATLINLVLVSTYKVVSTETVSN